MQNTIVDKPKKRSNLRLKLGKEYFILKRKLDWWRNRHAYSVIDKNNTCCYSHKKHQSVLLRQLKCDGIVAPNYSFSFSFSICFVFIG